MSRFITARGILLAALMLVAMACSDSSPEKTTTDGTRVPTTAGSLRRGERRGRHGPLGAIDLYHAAR